MIKLILTDLDETLIHYGLSRATDHAIAAIHEAQAAGVHFAAVTGRIMTGLLSAFGGDEQSCSTAALSNGQIVYVGGRLAHAEHLDHHALELVARFLAKEPGFVLNVILEAEHPHAHRVVVTDDPTDAERIHTTDGDTVSCSPSLPDDPVIKANIHVLDGVSRIPEVRARLHALSDKLRFISPGNQVPMLDIAPAHWSKAKGAEILCESLGVKADEVAVFGDAENDLELIELYPNSVAVANATREVSDAARWHIGAAADDAVADAILDIARAAGASARGGACRAGARDGAGTLPAFMSAEANARGLAERENPVGSRSVERLPIFTQR